jgi:hypothetical protein
VPKDEKAAMGKKDELTLVKRRVCKLVDDEALEGVAGGEVKIVVRAAEVAERGA